MPLLTNIIEPHRLLLSWQESDGDSPPHDVGGRRYLIGELSRDAVESNNVKLRYFTQDTDFAEAQNKGFEGYPAFSIEQETHTHDVMAAFARRVPSKAREDFEEYLTYWGISLEAGRAMTPFALLGYTGGILPGDAFNLIHTFEEVTPPCEFVLEVAGVRHYPEAMQLIEAGTLKGKPVIFINEPTNPYDSTAVQVAVDDKQIGYVKRGQTGFFNSYLEKATVNAVVERVNGRREKPCVLLYVKAA